MHIAFNRHSQGKLLQANDVEKKPSFAQRACSGFRLLIPRCALALLAVVSENVAEIESLFLRSISASGLFDGMHFSIPPLERRHLFFQLHGDFWSLNST
jgi:hypothetical protein